MGDFIKLGVSSDTLRGYELLTYKQYNATLANPFAAQINTKSEYGELESYSEWVVDDWQGGVGKRTPDAGGSLYSQMDTRFPNQMILPLGWDHPYEELGPTGGNNYASGDLTVDGTIVEKASASFTMGTTAHDIMAVWLYVDAVSGTTVTVDIYSDVANQPDASVVTTAGTGTITKYRPGPVWVLVEMDTTQLTVSTKYHVVASGSASLTFPRVTPPSGESANTYDGSTWTSASYGFQFLTGMTSLENNIGLEDGTGDSLLQEDDTEFLLVAGDDMIAWTVKAGERYFAAYSSSMVELNSDGSITTQVTVDADITDLFALGEQVFICYGLGYKVFNVDDDSTDDYADDATLMTVHGGYMWRAYENDLYYSTDGATWIQVTDIVGPDGYEVRGMAGLEENLYLSTDRGLYVLLPGNYIYPVKLWPTTDERNGAGMVEWNGNLYIPLAEDLMRYSADGTMLQVGLRTGESLPNDIQGEIYDLQPTSYFLLASVKPSDSDGYGSLWAYNEQGWHGIGLMPQGVAGGGVFLDTSTNPGKLIWGGDYGLLAQSDYPSSVINPIRDRGDKLFARHGWIEQDRFYGGHVTLDTDWESIYLDTEDMTDAIAYMYWQDQDSTDWELLGSTSEEDVETRWTLDSGVRPYSKWLKLGLLLRTDNEEETPILRGHVVKFHTMIADRWRWSVTYVLSGDSTQKQETFDGTMSEYTGAEMKTHLEGLIQQGPPYLLQDIDGTIYRVKTTQAARGIQKMETNSGTPEYQYVYSIVHEQVDSGTYS